MKIKISTRLVILTKTRAYKIPISKRGWMQGKNEKLIWNKYKKKFNLLAPFKYRFFGIVCQQRILPIFRIDEYAVKRAKKLMPEFDFENCDLYNAQNWGYYKGKILLLDYGVNLEISKLY
jgi:hypothetical protein